MLEPITIGRQAPANLRLPDDQVASGVHCKVEIDGQQLRVTDLKSTNGTRLNGLPVQSGTVRPDDVVAIGQSEFQLSMLDASEPSSSSSPPDALEQQREPDQTQIAAPDASQNKKGPGATDHLEETIDSGDGNLSWSTEDAEKLPTLPCDFADYRLLEMIGQGGMATVYRGVQRKSGETVAIKLIRAGGKPSKKQLSLFLREGALITRLKHPRIVEAYEMGSHEDQPFLAMEYLPTIDLLEVMATLKPEARIRTACWVISRLLQALHHAHGEGIVHRDVKISNLLAFREGHRLQVKLADFGLAKIVADSGISQLTNERSMRGTLAFMAPEQIKESRAVGFPADLYATGICLIRLLGGDLPKPAFESTGRNVEKVLRSLDSIPDALMRIIRKATAPLVLDRYANAEAMAMDLYPFHQRP